MELTPEETALMDRVTQLEAEQVRASDALRVAGVELRAVEEALLAARRALSELVHAQFGRLIDVPITSRMRPYRGDSTDRTYLGFPASSTIDGSAIVGGPGTVSDGDITTASPANYIHTIQGGGS